MCQTEPWSFNTVTEVERITRKIASDKVRKKKWTNTDAELIAIEKEFTDTLGTRVQISKTDFGGKLTIDYFSDDDLQKLLTIMKQEEEAKQAADGESTTVIRELSPEASLAAKLSQAVPLDLVDEQEIASPEMPSASDVGRHSIPQHEDMPFGSSYAAPVEEEVVSVVDEPDHVVESVEQYVVEKPAQASVASEAVPEYKPVSQREDAPAYIPLEPQVEDVPEIDPESPTVNHTFSSVTVPQVPAEEVVATEVAAQEVDESTEPDSVAPAGPVDVSQDAEFAFVAKHTDAARAEDLVNPYAQEVPTQTSPVVPVERPMLEEKAEDEDLYSMKNFSL